MLTRDVLQLIAEQIDDKKTWYSFALVNKTTNHIAQLLKDRKQKEFNPVPLEFWFNSNFNLSFPVVVIPYTRLQIMKGTLGAPFN
jgi:hypothetical protein